MHSYEVWMSINYSHKLGDAFYTLCYKTFDRLFIVETCQFYYLLPIGNGQAKSTNKVLGTLFTKLVSENKIDWDEHLPVILFSYKTTYKVTIRYTPY